MSAQGLLDAVASLRVQLNDYLSQLNTGSALRQPAPESLTKDRLDLGAAILDRVVEKAGDSFGLGAAVPGRDR